MSALFIITVSWLAIMLLVIVVCRMAAAGDRAMPAAAGAAARGAGLRDGPGKAAPPSSATAARRFEFVAYRLPKTAERELQAAAAEHVWDRAQQDLDVGP